MAPSFLFFFFFFFFLLFLPLEIHGSFDCANGTMTPTGCSCASGFTGLLCDTFSQGLNSSCPIIQPSMLFVAPVGSVDNGRIANSSLSFVVSSPSIAGRTFQLKFSDSPNCTYPGFNFIKGFSTENCTDTFAAAIPFLNVANDCDFTKNFDGVNEIYDGILSVSVTEPVQGPRGLVISRLITSSLEIELILPSVIEVSEANLVESLFNLMINVGGLVAHEWLNISETTAPQVHFSNLNFISNMTVAISPGQYNQTEMQEQYDNETSSVSFNVDNNLGISIFLKRSQSGDLSFLDLYIAGCCGNPRPARSGIHDPSVTQETVNGSTITYIVFNITDLNITVVLTQDSAGILQKVLVLVEMPQSSADFFSTDLQAVISKHIFLRADDVATIELTTFLAYPFSLLNASVSLPFDFPPNQIIVTNPAPCTTNSTCMQVTSFALTNVISSDLCSVSGSYTVSWSFNCQPGTSPCFITNQVISVTFNVSMPNLCGTFTVQNSVNGSLQSFSDPALSQPASTFLENSTIYFGIDLSSTLQLQTITLTNIYYSIGGDNQTWVWSLGNPQLEGSFSVNVQNQGNSPTFSFIPALAHGEAVVMTVTAKIHLTYSTAFSRKRGSSSKSVNFMTKVVIFPLEDVVSNVSQTMATFNSPQLDWSDSWPLLLPVFFLISLIRFLTRKEFLC